MTIKHTFFIGLNDKDTKLQQINTIDAGRVVERVFISHGVDGATISGARGVYKHDDGTVVCEETVMVQVFEFGDAIDVKGICEDLKKMLNQESIAVESTETNSALY